MADGTDSHFAIRTAEGIAAGPGTAYRVASISKIVTGQTLAGVNLDQTAGPLLGFDLTHPSGKPVTLRHLASHTASLGEDALPVPPTRRLTDWIAEAPIWLDAPPGTYFSYSNLGYILLAACAERLHRKPFERITSQILNAWGVRGGFNWSGMDDATRRAGLPIFRRDGDSFLPQIDASEADRLVPEPPGLNIARFSPQGGLRTSLRGLLAIARALPKLDADPLWWQQSGPGDYLGGVFEHYGLGLQVFEEPTFYPRPLIGHFGNAYGFNGGVWFDAKADLCFAYALNGLEIGDEDDTFSETELTIFDAMARLKG